MTKILKHWKHTSGARVLTKEMTLAHASLWLLCTEKVLKNVDFSHLGKQANFSKLPIFPDFRALWVALN